MEVNEIYEAFGLEAPEENTDTGTDTGAEADVDTDVDTDVAHEDGTDDADDGMSNGDDGKGKPDTGTQTKEERAGYAAARRRAEAEAREREAKAVKEAEERATINTLKAVGAKNPFTGKIIETAEDLAAYRSAQSDRAKQQFMRSAGQTEEAYRQTIESLPEVVAARQAQKDAESRAAIAEGKIREAEEAEFRLALDEEVKRIAETGEDVKTLEDVTKLEKYAEIREKVNRGYTLEDAYRSVYRKEIEERQANVRAERAAAAAASKNHLGKTSGKGAPNITVPADVLSTYKLLNPNMSDADIVKHYAKTMKSSKR